MRTCVTIEGENGKFSVSYQPASGDETDVELKVFHGSMDTTLLVKCSTLRDLMIRLLDDLPLR